MFLTATNTTIEAWSESWHCQTRETGSEAQAVPLQKRETSPIPHTA